MTCGTRKGMKYFLRGLFFLLTAVFGFGQAPPLLNQAANGGLGPTGPQALTIVNNWFTYLQSTAPIAASRLTGTLAIGLFPTSGVSAGTYTNATVTIDIYGRVTVAMSGASSVCGTTGQLLFNNSGVCGGLSTLGNSYLQNPSLTVNGVTCTLGSSCTPAGGSPAGATNTIQKNGGSGAFGASSCLDNGTTFACTEPISTGSSPPPVTPGTGGGYACALGTAPSAGPASGVGLFYCDSATNTLKLNLNNAGYLPIVQGPASSTNAHCAQFSGTSGGVLADSGGACGGGSGGDIYDITRFIVANCSSGTATNAMISLGGTSFTTDCIGGANNLTGMAFATPTSGPVFYLQYTIPGDWDTTKQSFLNIFYNSYFASSGTVQFTANLGCAKVDGTASWDPAYTTDVVMTAQTMTTAQNWAQSGQFLHMDSAHNCVPGGAMWLKISMGGTTSTSVAVFQANITTARTNTFQAN